MEKDGGLLSPVSGLGERSPSTSSNWSLAKEKANRGKHLLIYPRTLLSSHVEWWWEQEVSRLHGGRSARNHRQYVTAGAGYRTGHPGRSEPGVDAVRSGRQGDSWGRRLTKGEI